MAGDKASFGSLAQDNGADGKVRALLCSIVDTPHISHTAT
jgi:hypothetical protein